MKKLMREDSRVPCGVPAEFRVKHDQTLANK
jgi:hypothetical protein